MKGDFETRLLRQLQTVYLRTVILPVCLFLILRFNYTDVLRDRDNLVCIRSPRSIDIINVSKYVSKNSGKIYSKVSNNFFQSLRYSKENSFGFKETLN